jgi:hypothetical protein
MTAVAEGTHFYALDEGGVLFCEPAQRLYGLNAAAAYCWLALRDGLPEAEAALELEEAGAPPGQGGDWWRRSLEIFRAEGFLADSAAAPVDRPPAAGIGLMNGQRLERVPDFVAERRYRLFDTRFHVGFTTEAPLSRIEGMLANLAAAPGAAADVEIAVIGVGERFLVARDGRIVGIAPDLDRLATQLEQALTLTAIDATPHLLSLHSGLLQRGPCGLLLPAASGSGKTTLTSALAHRGWSFGTDELVLLKPDGSGARAAPLSPCIKTGSWPVLAPLFPELMRQPVHERFGRQVRYLPLPGQKIEEAGITHVVFPRYAAAAESGLRPVERQEGLRRLFVECVSVPSRLDPAQAGRLVDWARQVAFYELKFSGLEEALAAIDSATGG